MDEKLGLSQDDLNYFFGSMDKRYNDLKETVAEEISKYKTNYERQKKLNEILKSKLQARDLLELLLPILSDIKNNVDDIDDVAEMRKMIAYRYNEIRFGLEKIGVKLLSHEKNQDLLSNEIISQNSKVVKTGDRSLDKKVARTVQMGCIIKGEENNPIGETVELYAFDPALEKAQQRSSQATLIIQKDDKTSSTLQTPSVGNKEAKNDSESGYTASDARALSPDVVMLKNGYFRPNRNICIYSYEQKHIFTLFKAGEEYPLQTTFNCLLPTTLPSNVCSVYLDEDPQKVINKFSVPKDFAYIVDFTKKDGVVFLIGNFVKPNKFELIYRRTLTSENM